MMLGPLGQSYWLGPDAMPKAALHHDWSRVAFPAAATTNALDAFSYGASTQQPAAITAAIGATAANELDTSLAKADALSRDCIATHLGIKIDNVALVTAGDVILTLAATRQVISRLLVRVFYAARVNEEFVGKVEDLPEGKGFMIDGPNDAANVLERIADAQEQQTAALRQLACAAEGNEWHVNRCRDRATSAPGEEE